MRSILELDLKELEKVLGSWGKEPFRAKQILSWIYKKGILSFNEMSDIPVEFREKLKREFHIISIKEIKRRVSSDGTEKLLLGLSDKNLIEAVVIPQEKRVTGCISTQAGCKFACSFCASGAAGFKRNLNCFEIIEQVLVLSRRGGLNLPYGSSKQNLTHIVFMGTGEPFDNYDNVFKAIRILNAPWGLNIGARRITISTCGIAPGIKKLAQEGLQVELSVSLHAAEDKLRSRIMPVNAKYPLGDLIAACKEYIHKTGRQVTFEYVMIKGVNSSLQNAKNLGRILKGIRLAKVNLILANPVKDCGIAAPDNSEVAAFCRVLKAAGVHFTLRKERGADIEAACGQLRLHYEAQ